MALTTTMIRSASASSLGISAERVLARFAQAAGIEEAEKALLLIGEGVHLGRAGAGPEAAADFGAAAAGHGVNERCLSRLGLAQEPDDRRRQGRFRRAEAIVERARIDFGASTFRQILFHSDWTPVIGPVREVGPHLTILLRVSLAHSGVG